MQRNFARPQRLDSFKFLFGLVTLLGVVAAVKPAYALPTKDQVPQAAPLPIDGEWETTVWGQHLTFRLEKGRWYATTAYTVALLWPVHVDDVTTQDVRATAAGKYVGYDLVLVDGPELGARTSVPVPPTEVFLQQARILPDVKG